MKYIVCDITGRTINYDVALCEAINNELQNDSELIFLCSGLFQKYAFRTHSFFSLVPSKKKTENKLTIRILKVIDTLCAYMWIVLYLLFNKVDIFHLQWFPFLSIGLTGSFIDIFFVKIIRMISPKTKLVYTIHNVCPHGMNNDDIPSYNKVFSKALNYFDEYIVHTESTKEYVTNQLRLENEQVNVIYHGIFNPKDFTFSPVKISEDKIKIIMYGFQNFYKGTDILTEALSLVKDEYKHQIEVIICGAISNDYYNKCTNVDAGVFVKWIPRFLTDKELYEYIDASNIIVLPYRRISQSGVLLLALNTRRYIITSDLPSFKETLKGFPDETFFRSEDPHDLARVINAYCEKRIDLNKIQKSIEYLNDLYSWKQSALNTIKLYKS